MALTRRSIGHRPSSPRRLFAPRVFDMSRFFTRAADGRLDAAREARIMAEQARAYRPAPVPKDVWSHPDTDRAWR